MTEQTEHLREMKIPESGLEIRMPLTPYVVCELNPYYSIRAVRPNSYREIARVSNFSINIGRFPVMYKVTRCLPLSKTRHKIVGLAFSSKSADKKAHKEALSLANYLSRSNRNIPVKDFSEKDKKNLIEILEIINKKSGGQ